MSRLRALAIPLLFCAGGLVLAHHEMVLTGFRFTQNDLGDTRFCNYLLEHGWRWLTRHPAHLALFSPPYFYPATDTLAYAENMLGTMPIYALFRAAGLAVDTAFQGWILAVSSLNFIAAYALFRRCFRLSIVASSVGGALFAFAAIRVNQTMHFQLFPQFFSVWLVHGAYRLLEPGALERPVRDRHASIALFFFGLVGQIYACIYLGWYLGFMLAVAGVLGLAVPSFRRPLLALLKAHPGAIALGGLCAIAVAGPLLWRYAEIGRAFGLRPFAEARSMIPQPRAWAHHGPFSWLYGSLASHPWFRGIPMEHEQRNGFGLATSAACLVGLWWGRRARGVQVLGLLLFLGIALSSMYGPWTTGFTPWEWVYAYFPGAQAIRGVARIGLLFLLGVALGVGVLLDRLERRGLGAKLGATTLGLLCVLEQGQTTPSFSKEKNRQDIAAVASKVGAGCESFLLSPVQGYGPYWKYQLDAMMAQLETGVPTMNGYSGHNPPQWPFGDTNLHTQEQAQRVQRGLADWEARHALAPSKQCWVRVPLEEGPYRALFIGQAVPRQMVAGRTYRVEVVMRNDAQPPWQAQQGFRLGAQSPQDNRVWGMNRVPLPEEVRTGHDAVFRFEVTAPSEPGTYPFQWQLLRENVMWFPAMSERVDVTVTPAG